MLAHGSAPTSEHPVHLSLTHLWELPPRTLSMVLMLMSMLVVMLVVTVMSVVVVILVLFVLILSLVLVPPSCPPIILHL
jgi:hypothetical protein